ncbi:hypothetical protein [Massilia sp. GCM10023247]|uniref:hypothetical protein n=1 Tax=Massilia sp. GCM10023247 TaxID=3252643 RepID=UPI00361E5D45
MPSFDSLLRWRAPSSLTKKNATVGKSDYRAVKFLQEKITAQLENTMKRCQGITEPFWSTLSEDHRLAWKYASRTIGLVMALLMTLLVAKTGNIYMDWGLTAVTAIFLVIAIETQRSYSKLSPPLRKANIRILIFLGSWGIAFIGIAYFSQTAFIACVKVFAGEVWPILGLNRHVLISYVFMVIFVIGAPVAVIRVIRQLSVEQLIYHLPRQGLKRMFMRRPYKATSFAMFAYFELALLVVCLIYTSVVVMLVKSFLFIVSALSGA